MPEEPFSNSPADIAASYEIAQERQKLSDKLTALIRKYRGWVVSRPAQMAMRFECNAGDKEACTKLEELGFRVAFLGIGQRVAASGPFRVSVYEIRLPK